MNPKRKIWRRIALAQLVVLLVLILVWVLANRLPRVEHYNKLLEPAGARAQLETDVLVEPMPEPNTNALEVDIGFARFRWPYEPFTEIRWRHGSARFLSPGQGVLTVALPDAYGYQVEGGPDYIREIEQEAQDYGRSLDFDDSLESLAEIGEDAYEIEQALALLPFLPEQLDHPYAWHKAITAAKPTSAARVLFMNRCRAHRYLKRLEDKLDLLSECTDLCLLEGSNTDCLCRQIGPLATGRCDLVLWDNDRRLTVFMSVRMPKTAHPSLEPVKQLAGSFRFTVESFPEDYRQATPLILQTLVRLPNFVADTDDLCRFSEYLTADLFGQVAAHCPDLNAVGSHRNHTQLLAAVTHARPEIITALLDAGADVNAPMPDGQTPLHWAAKRNDPALAEHLLSRGADPNIVDLCGFTPLAQATDAVAPLLAPAGAQLLDQASMPIIEERARSAAGQVLGLLDWWQEW